MSITISRKISSFEEYWLASKARRRRGRTLRAPRPLVNSGHLALDDLHKHDLEVTTIPTVGLKIERTHVDPEVPSLIADAIGGALRGAELTRSLVAYSRCQPLDPKVSDIGQRVGEVAKLVKRTIGENIVVEVSTPVGLWPVKIDGAQLDTCIVNLTDNARLSEKKTQRPAS